MPISKLDVQQIFVNDIQHIIVNYLSNDKLDVQKIIMNNFQNNKVYVQEISMHLPNIDLQHASCLTNIHEIFAL